MKYFYPSVALVIFFGCPSCLSAEPLNSQVLHIFPSSSERFFDEGRQQLETEILKLPQARSRSEQELLTVDEEGVHPPTQDCLEDWPEGQENELLLPQELFNGPD